MHSYPPFTQGSHGSTGTKQETLEINTQCKTDEISKGHVILTFDIEVEMNSGLPNVHQAQNEITSVAFHDSATNDYYVYVVSIGEEINKTIKGAKVRSFNTERDLLLAFVTSWEKIYLV